MKYVPEPLDTRGIELGGEIRDLTEALARNVHEIWAQRRIEDGWRYGPERNDKRKEHNCLVPYSELPEHEKEYDRRVATETLKAIVKLGFRIEKTY